ncbi:hypothetical protein NPIL_483681 [Nephila pilipes]|uniref:Uncharacterized protein n=1 Tax=Nephila pilipes TaxID=299642 RepID=A0A8X6R0T1_NEPPI|nr:hypothetical protein NPIL_483681 [Nephila pilipes]
MEKKRIKILEHTSNSSQAAASWNEQKHGSSRQGTDPTYKTFASPLRPRSRTEKMSFYLPVWRIKNFLSTVNLKRKCDEKVSGQSNYVDIKLRY